MRSQLCCLCVRYQNYRSAVEKRERERAHTVSDVSEVMFIGLARCSADKAIIWTCLAINLNPDEGTFWTRLVINLNPDK